MSLLNRWFGRKPTQAAFSEIIVRELEKVGMGKVVLVEGEFALKVGNGQSTIFLSNVYANYCGAPRNKRSTVLAEFVSGAAAIPSLPGIPPNFDTAKPSLMPTIRDAATFSLMQLMDRKAGKHHHGLDVVTKRLVGSLAVALAYDTEHNITAINYENFEKWGVSLEEALAAAKDNLWERTDPSRMAGQNGVFWSQWGDSYDSSRMLLPELIYRVSVDGDPIAFVPNRNELWVTGTNNYAGLASILRQGTESHFNRGHSLSPDLFRLEGGRWQQYVPEDATLRGLWMTIRQRRDAIDYRDQQDLLKAIYQREGIDIFVAGYHLFDGKAGPDYSLCVWSNGVDSLLPQTERIAFAVNPEGKSHLVVSWASALPIIGDLLEEEPEFAPVRYRARKFPDEVRIAKLRQLAL